MKDYEKQAQDFLTATETEFKTEYLGFDKHFVGDTEERHRYRCIFTRKGRSLSVDFGNALVVSAAEYGRLRRLANCELKSRQRLNEVEKQRKAPPTPYDVLASLVKYDPETFESFVNEFGYSDMPLIMYPQVREIYDAVQKQYYDVIRFWSPEERKMLEEIS